MKNPTSSSHIKSEFHQEKLKERAVAEEKEEKEVEELEGIKDKSDIDTISVPVNVEEKVDDIIEPEDIRAQLKENLFDEDGYIKIGELEPIEIHTDAIEKIVGEFLQTEYFLFKFEHLDEIFIIFNVLMKFLSFDEIIARLDRFSEDKLREELENNISEIDVEYFRSTSYGFDLIVKLVSQFLGREKLIQFLLDIEDLEEFISKSYYEETEAPFNPTMMEIEHSLSEALRGDSQEVYNDSIAIINSSGMFFEHLRKKLLNTFRVNKYISLKLVGNRTNIYVNDQLFNQCKYLLLNIRTDKIREYDSIGSIDEAAEKLDPSMHGREGHHDIVPPETEFWGHCSNLQAWADNNYDTRLLHRNLAFPLLKRLTEVGDPKAREVFKNELSNRIKDGYLPVIEYLMAGGYLSHLSGADLDDLLDSFLNIDFKSSEYRPYYQYRGLTQHNLLEQFARMGSKRAKLMISEIMVKDLKTGDILVVQQYLNRDFIRHVGEHDINEIFKIVKDTVVNSQNQTVKLYVLKRFADLNVIKARAPLRKAILDRVEKANLTEMQSMISTGYFNYLGKNEVSTIFNDLDLEEEDWNINKLQLVGNFAALKIENANDLIKTGVKKILKTGDLRNVEHIIYQNYLRFFNREEIDDIFEILTSNNIFQTININLLTILKKFADQEVEKAKKRLNQYVKEKVKTASIYEYNQIIFQNYLRFLTENELKELFKEINYEGLFNQDINTSIRILERLKKIGLSNADQIIKDQLFDKLKHPNTRTLDQVLNKSSLKLFTNEDLKDLIKDKDSNLIEGLFKIAIAQSTRYNLRDKVVRFLKSIRAISGEALSNKIIGALKQTDIEMFSNFMRGKLITILSEEEKQKLLKDPNCLLSQFIVKYHEKEYHVDYNLELNLSNKGIQDLTEIKGLNNLKKLKALDLRNNNLDRIVGIGNLKELKKLRLRGNLINEDLIEHLGGLDRYGNAINPQKFVEYSRRIEAGDISHIVVGDKKIEIFSDELILKNMGITSIYDIKGIHKFNSLKKLDLSHNKLENIRGMQRLKSLKSLNLSYNKLNDVTGLDKLANLEELRLYGNGIHELKAELIPKNLKIIDLDSKRKLPDNRFLRFLLQTLTMEQLKQICRDHQIRGYSRYTRDRLVMFIIQSLSEEEIRTVISRLEIDIISTGINTAIRMINNQEREFLESYKITNTKKNEIELKFKGFSWEIKSYLSITPETINDPERDCDCRNGSSGGLCNHFWVGFIFSLKQGYFKLSEWTLTKLPLDLEEKLKPIKLITTKSGEKRLINEELDDSLLIENLNSRVFVHEADLTKLERRQYMWEDNIVTYYLSILKNVKISPDDKKEDITDVKSLVVRFSENMYKKFKLYDTKKVQLSGEVQKDPYIGLLLKNVFVLKGDMQQKLNLEKKEPKSIKRDVPKVEAEKEKRIKININEIRDGLGGNWWIHIQTKSLNLIERILVVEGYEVEEDDIIIHKEIVLGDRYPTTRYHLVQGNRTRLVESYQVKNVLIKGLINHVKKNKILPIGCMVTKSFKNGSIQINYNPSADISFALKVMPNTEGVANPLEFFEKAKTQKAPEKMQERVELEGDVANQWFIESYSDPNKRYKVTLYPNGRWACTCPHHVFRGAICKHINQIMRTKRN